MEKGFAARHVWDVQAARALAHVWQRPPLWKIGIGIVILGAAGLAAAWWLNERQLGWTSFATGALLGAYVAFGVEPMAAKKLYAQSCGRSQEALLAFGAAGVEAKDEYSRCVIRYEGFRRFVSCRGRYLLFYRRQSALIFAPESVSGGDAHALEVFVREKTGLGLETIR